jgi:hypothetical protein
MRHHGQLAYPKQVLDIQRILGRNTSMPDTSNESPFDPFPEEVVAKIREIVREALSQPPKGQIGGTATLRVKATGTLTVSGVVTPRYIDPSLLTRLRNDPVLKKFLEIPSAWDLLVYITTILIAFSQYHQEDSRAALEEFGQVIEKQFKEFEAWMEHRYEPQPKPPSDAKGD